MIIIDIPRAPNSDEYFRIGVIGSCRVRDLFYEAYNLEPKPPESIDAPECPLVWFRYAAFTHTFSQAHQYQRFVTKRLEIPDDLQPFVLLKHITPATQTKLSTLTSELIESIDLYAVEISTFKNFSVGEFHLNASYTETKLVRAGGKPILKWWRSVAGSDSDHPRIIKETLDALPSKDVENTAAIRSIISNGRWHTQTRAEAEASLHLLMEDLGKPLVIVPQFNTPDNPTENRVQLIDELQRLATQQGCHFFDPTVVVASAGRTTALKGGGTDTMHYEKGFHYTLLKAVVPFLQNAVSLYERTGEFSALRYQPPRGLMTTATCR